MPDLYDASSIQKAPSITTESTEVPAKVAELINIPKTEEKAPRVAVEQEIPTTAIVKKLEVKQAIRDFIPRKSGFSWSSLIVLPSKKVRFETQDQQEEVLVILRAHWITNIPWLLIGTAMFFAPKLLAFFPLLDGFPVRFQTAFVVAWYLVTVMYVVEKFLSWFFDLGIITDERVIDVDLKGLTDRRIADAELDKIQDVTFTNKGVVGTVFNFGNVLIQTAAELVQFVFEDVPRPAKVAEILQKMRLEEKQEAMEGRIR